MSASLADWCVGRGGRELTGCVFSQPVNFMFGALLSVANLGNWWAWGANESLMLNLVMEKGIEVGMVSSTVPVCVYVCVCMSLNE